MSSPTVKVKVSGASGRSYADLLRATGAYGVLPSDTDEEAVQRPVDLTLALAGGAANYRATRADGVADFAVGDFFSSAETGELRIYKRIAGSPFYEDQGDDVAPLTKTMLAGDSGAANVGFKQVGAGARLRTILEKLRDTVSITDFVGATGDGDADDAEAFNHAIAAVTEGGKIYIPQAPTQWTIKSEVSIDKAVTFVGPGRKEKLLITGSGSLKQAASDVRFESIGFEGNRASGNKAIVNDGGHSKLSLQDFYADKFDVFCDIEGGYFHSFKSGEVRNMASSTWRLDKNPAGVADGVNGNDAFFDDILHDTDTGTYSEPVAVIDCLDFDCVVTSDTCDFIHGGTAAGVYIHPIGVGGSSNHRLRHFCDTTAGAGVQFSPTTPAFCTRSFLRVWASTCGRGLLVDGNGYAETTVIDIEAHHNSNEAVRFSNTNVNSAIYIKGGVMMSNNVADVGASDIDIGGNCAYAEVSGVTFGVGQGWIDQSQYFVNLGPDVIAADLSLNTLKGTGRAGKFNGLTSSARRTTNNNGFITDGSGQGTITSGGTTVTVTHGLDRTPGIEDIQLTYQSVSRGTVSVRPSNVTATQFDIVAEAAASGGNCIINWAAKYQ